MIAIINYGVGNLTSVLNMCKRIGAEAIISSDVEEIKNADRLLLPGVGHFDSCMQQFNKSGLRATVEQKVFNMLNNESIRPPQSAPPAVASARGRAGAFPPRFA